MGVVRNLFKELVRSYGYEDAAIVQSMYIFKVIENVSITIFP